MGKIIGALIAISIILSGCNAAADDDTYYKEMNSINVEFNDAISFVSDTLKNETNNGDFQSKLDLARSKMTELYRKVGELTPPDEFKDEHEYYKSVISEARSAVVSIKFSDEEKYNDELKESARLKKLAQPLINKFQGE